MMRDSERQPKLRTLSSLIDIVDLDFMLYVLPRYSRKRALGNWRRRGGSTTTTITANQK
jgi:hypothetical protein